MVADDSPDEVASDRLLRLDEAYQGRAMFVKVQCKVGEAPSQLSHHPELRFRFPPRAKDGAPLIANSVSIQVRGDARARIQTTCKQFSWEGTNLATVFAPAGEMR